MIIVEIFMKKHIAKRYRLSVSLQALDLMAITKFLNCANDTTTY